MGFGSQLVSTVNNDSASSGPFPENYRAPLYDALDAEYEKKYGLPPGLLKSIRINGEKTNASQVSPAGAKTPYQFIESTRKGIMNQYKLDPWSSPRQAAESAAILLRDNYKKYGSWQNAVAAYNGGGGGVSNPKPETVDYVNRVGQPFGWSASSGMPSTKISTVENVQATPQEKANMSQPRQAVQDVFNPQTTTDLSAAQQDATQRIGFADQLLQKVTADSQQVRQQNQEQLQQTVDAKKKINDGIRADLEHLTNIAEPVWQKREALAEQLLKVDNMNPLESGIRGIFDPNYSRTNLKARLNEQDAALGEIENVFAERYKYAQTLSDLATADYNNSSQVADLLLKNGGEDVRLALQSYGIATQKMDQILSGVQADAAVTTAKNQARADLLSGMSIGQINEAVKMADANGGIAVVNGVQLRMGELKDAQDRLVKQDLSLQSMKMSIDAQNLNLADAHEDNLISTMNLADVQGAISNNGQFHGVNLDLAKLGSRLQQLQQGQAAMVQQSQLSTAPGIVSQMFGQFSAINKVQAARFAGLLGRIPEQFTAFNNQATATIQAYMKGLEAAKANGTAEEYIASQAPVIQNLLKGQQAIVDEAIKTWSGGDTDLMTVGTAWMSGQPVDSASAVKALIHIARGDLPPGTVFRGTAATVLNIVRKKTQEYDAKASANGMQTIDDIMNGVATNKPGSAAAEALLVRQVQAEITKHYNSTLGNEVFNSLPGYASSMKDSNGKPFAFARVSRDAWNQATALGDQQGIVEVAKQLGMRPEDFKAMMQQGPDGSLWKEKVKGLGGQQADFKYWAGALQAAQIQQTMANLDASSADTGFVPSQALRDLVTDPNFDAAMRKTTTGDANASFGGFISSMASGGNFTQDFQNMVDTIDSAYTTRQTSLMAYRKTRANQLLGDPFERTKFILGAIPGLTPQQESLLVNESKRLFASRDRGELPFGLTNYAQVGDTKLSMPDLVTDQSIHEWIMNGKSENPQVDAALKLARKHWEDIAPNLKGTIETYFGGGQ